MQDVTNRTLRTGGQAAIAEGLIQLAIAFGAPITAQEHVALLPVLTAAITFLYNLAERGFKQAVAAAVEGEGQA
jgi:hypothetical protein